MYSNDDLKAAAHKGLSASAAEIPEAMSIFYNNLVYDLKREGKHVTTLSLGEAFFDIPMLPFDGIDFSKGYHYSHSRGMPDLREKISGYYRMHYDIDSDPDTEVLISAGSKVLIFMALRALLDPGEEVVIFEPAWVSYTEQVRLCYGTPKTIPHYEGITDLEKYLTDKTKVVIINNPNNPSGKVYTEEELQQLCALARKHGFYVISDEAYSDFVSSEPFISAAAFDPQKSHVIVVNSLSKNLGISGWRLGYCITNSELLDTILKINQHLITCPATILQQYLVQHFETLIEVTHPQIQHVLADRQRIAEFMDEIGISYLPGSGTFYFCISIEGSGLGSEAFAMRLLKSHYISTVPGIGYGESLDSFLRVGVGTEPVQEIERALSVIKEMKDGKGV